MDWLQIRDVDGTVQQQGFFEITATSLVMTRQVSLETWTETYQHIRSLQKATPWWVGDLLAQGEALFAEDYASAIEEMGYNVTTLQNYKWVCSHIIAQDRREELSFSHHALVAALPRDEQKLWLELAIENEWSTAELRAKMNEPVTLDEIDSIEPSTEPEEIYSEVYSIDLSYSELGAVWSFFVKHEAELTEVEKAVMQRVEEAWNRI